MKKINLLFAALIGAMTMTLTSCDECADVTCENGGTCEEGVCQCPDNFFGDACEVECVNGTYGSGSCTCEAGYEGDACSVVSRDAWVGLFNGDDGCGFTYESTVSENGSAIDEVSISDFGGLDVTIIGKIINSTEITIETQTDASSREFSGYGTLASTGNTINITYTVKFDNGTQGTCTVVYTRK